MDSMEPRACLENAYISSRNRNARRPAPAVDLQAAEITWFTGRISVQNPTNLIVWKVSEHCLALNSLPFTLKVTVESGFNDWTLSEDAQHSMRVAFSNGSFLAHGLGNQQAIFLERSLWNIHLIPDPVGLVLHYISGCSILWDSRWADKVCFSLAS